MLSSTRARMALGLGLVAALAAAGGAVLAILPGAWPFSGDDTSAGAVQVYDARVEFPDALSVLEEPVFHLAADQSTGDLWFATLPPSADNPDLAAPKLYHYAAASGSLDSWAMPADVGTGLWSGITTTDSGHVILAYGHTVIDFDPATGFYNSIALPDKTAYPIEVPNQTGAFVTAVAAGPKGEIYIGRMNAASVTRLDLATGAASELPIPATFGPIVDMKLTPQGLALTNWFGFGYNRQSAFLDTITSKLTPGPAHVFNFAVAKDGTVYATNIDEPGTLRLAGGQATSVTPQSLKEYLRGTSDRIAADNAADAIWFAGQGSATIARWDRGSGQISVYNLGFRIVSGKLTHCIDRAPDGTAASCPSAVALPIAIGALAPDGKGNVYFADQTASVIGIVHP